MERWSRIRTFCTTLCVVTIVIYLVSFLKNEHSPLQTCVISKAVDSGIKIPKPDTVDDTEEDIDIKNEIDGEINNSEYNDIDNSNNDYNESGSDDENEVQFWGDGGLPMCPSMPPKRKGRLTIDREALPFDELESLFPDLQKGGRYKPKDCSSPDPIGIIIPHRNRESHLKVLLRNLHKFLIDQKREYVIYVVNQEPPTTFNKASLLNIGFTKIAEKYPDIQCFIFHDVDLIPLDDRLSYSCSDEPVHLSVAIDKFHYKLTEKGLFGGVVAMTKKMFTEVNGYNNVFFGWGAEAEDLRYRLNLKGYKLKRNPIDISRFSMIKHKRDEGNEKNFDNKRYLKKSKRCLQKVGLNTLTYKLVAFEERKLFTWVDVSINRTEVIERVTDPSCTSAY